MHALNATIRSCRSVALVLAVMSVLPFITPPARGQEKPASREDRKISLVLVGHGGFPKNFPDLKKYFELQHDGGEEFEKIEKELIRWPRTDKNDSYWSGFMKVVAELRKSGRYSSVHAAFNEYCAPTVGEALEEAVATAPDVIVVTSIMLTPGGVHSEKDIPASIDSFAKKNPRIRIVYAWPYDVAEVSQFLAAHATNFIPAR